MINPKTDCHCHILPGLDDGAGSLEESVALARRPRRTERRWYSKGFFSYAFLEKRLQCYRFSQCWKRRILVKRMNWRVKRREKATGLKYSKYSILEWLRKIYFEYFPAQRLPLIPHSLRDSPLPFCQIIIVRARNSVLLCTECHFWGERAPF